MRSKPIVPVVFAIALVTAGFVADSAPPSVAELWQKTQAGDEQARAAVFDALGKAFEQDRREYVERCVAIIEANAGSTDEARAARGLAMGLLGKTRAEEALPILVKHIGDVWPDYVSERGLFTAKPAMRALVEIGLPAVKHLCSPATLGETKADDLHRYALVIRHVFPDAKTARAFVEAYDPGYNDSAKAKHAELKKLLAELK
jgi:hypothetical protein